MVGVSGAPAIVLGTVTHRRMRPAAHAFAYRVFYLRVPLSRLHELEARGVALDRFGLVAFHRRDFGPRDGSDLEAWARALLAAHGMTAADGEIVLQAFPRVLGYVFNPIATWECHDRAGRLRAVICEVSNTFGERHNYLVAHADGREIGASDAIEAAKVFHVSPFCEVRGRYRFQFAADDARPGTCIDYFDDGGPLLATAMHGVAEALTPARVRRAFASHPAMTFAVIARIHWQALRLWARRVPWFSKPQPPVQETTR